MVQVWKHLWGLAVVVAQKLVVCRLWIVLEVVGEMWIVVACVLVLGLLKGFCWIRATNRKALELIWEGVWKFLSHLEWFPRTRKVLKGLSETQIFLELSGSKVLGPNVVTL